MTCRCGNSYEDKPELFECVIKGKEVVICIICGSTMTLNCSRQNCETCESGDLE